MLYARPGPPWAATVPISLAEHTRTESPYPGGGSIDRSSRCIRLSSSWRRDTSSWPTSTSNPPPPARPASKLAARSWTLSSLS
eukprot:scaffold14161_cov112-Isochrysis_galbana.AAC.6